MQAKREGLADTVSLARAETRRMDEVARRTKDGDAVSMDVRQFRHLADMIARLCDLCEEEEWVMGSPRSWVPLDIFEKLRLRCE